jgi:hypothetical protein
MATARVFAELAERSRPEGDALRADASRAAFVLLLEALHWAAVACGSSDSGGQADVLAAFDEALIERAAQGDADLVRVKAALATPPRGEKVVDAEALQVLFEFSGRLLRELEAPLRQAEREKALRMTKIAAAALLGVVALVVLAWRLVVPEDLAASAKMTTSSTQKQCVSPVDCGNAVFHTRQQHNPWVMYDLGEKKRIRLVKVHNRSDCCYERAVPLVLETSDDGKTWVERGRRREVFLNWSTTLDLTARYVRLRTPRQTYLHLGPVVIR